jgi:hypothetical protein
MEKMQMNLSVESILFLALAAVLLVGVGALILLLSKKRLDSNLEPLARQGDLMRQQAMTGVLPANQIQLLTGYDREGRQWRFDPLNQRWEVLGAGGWAIDTPPMSRSSGGVWAGILALGLGAMLGIVAVALGISGHQPVVNVQIPAKITPQMPIIQRATIAAPSSSHSLTPVSTAPNQSGAAIATATMVVPATQPPIPTETPAALIPTAIPTIPEQPTATEPSNVNPAPQAAYVQILSLDAPVVMRLDEAASIVVRYAWLLRNASTIIFRSSFGSARDAVFVNPSSLQGEESVAISVELRNVSDPIHFVVVMFVDGTWGEPLSDKKEMDLHVIAPVSSTDLGYFAMYLLPTQKELQWPDWMFGNEGVMGLGEGLGDARLYRVANAETSPMEMVDLMVFSSVEDAQGFMNRVFSDYESMNAAPAPIDLGDEGFAAQSEYEVRVGRFVLRTFGDIDGGQITPSVQRLQEFAQ